MGRARRESGSVRGARGAGGLGESARADSDRELVAAARRGDDRAFEALYARHHRRVAAYVLGMVKDRGRAEDVVQEVFLSALLRIRRTERPIAFEPWIYAIARNACIDHFRRSQRAHEVSFEVEEEGGALAGSAAAPETVLSTKQELDHLRGAFGALSDAQHEVLVLRELEGLSHREIGERLGLSRVAVESALARARRRLAAEYEELASGARCRRIQRIVASASSAGLDSREESRLARHLAHCQPCRRDALAAGIDVTALTDVPLRRRGARRLAALFPVPALARLSRGRGGEADAGGALVGLSEQLHAGWGKAAAAAAVVIAGAGAAGVGTEIATGPEPAPAPQSRPAVRHAPTPAEPRELAGWQRVAWRQAGTAAPKPDHSSRGRESRRDGGRDDRRRRLAPADPPRPGAERPAGGAPGPTPAEPTAPSGRKGDGAGHDGRGADSSSPSAPAGEPPPSGGPSSTRTISTGVANTVGNTLNGVDDTVQGVTGGLEGTLEGVGHTLEGSPQGLAETLEGATDTVEGATGGLESTLDGAADGLGETVAGIGDLLQPR